MNILESLPIELFSDVLEYISNPDDIRSLVLQNHRIKLQTCSCIKGISSPKIVKIPLKLLSKYNHLERIDNIICQIIDEEDALTIRNMKRLMRASFTIPLKTFWNLERLFLHGELLDRVRSTTCQFSFALVNNDKYYEVGIIGNGSHLTLSGCGPRSPMKVQYHGGNIHYFFSKLGDQFKSLILEEGEEYIANVYDRPLKYLIQNMRQFLKEADLGLVDPSQPPGSNNPPLKVKIPIIMGGLSKIWSLSLIFGVYGYYHNLIKRFDYIIPDGLIIKYFESIIRDTIMKNEPLLYELTGPYKCDLLEFVKHKPSPEHLYNKIRINDVILSDVLLTNMTNRCVISSQRTFNDIDFMNLSETLPIVKDINQEALRNEIDILTSTYKKYINLKIMEQGHYTTDGKFVSF